MNSVQAPHFTSEESEAAQPGNQEAMPVPDPRPVSLLGPFPLMLLFSTCWS